MWADLLSVLDERSEHKAAHLRKRFPRFALALDDWYLAQSHHNAFVFNEMPVGWQKTQRVLSAEYQRFQTWMQVQQIQKTDVIGQILKARAGIF